MKSKIVALSKNEDFKNLLKKKKIYNKYITIFFGTLKNKDNKKLNISFVTKKKQIKSAVKRNKVKRRLRNIMNDLVKKLQINFNLSYLVIAKTTMLNNEYQVIKVTLFQDFKKIK
jgi:ribonuclease P protein component